MLLGLDTFAAQNDSQPQIADALKDYMDLPTPLMRSHPQSEQALALVAKLNSLEQHSVYAAIMDRIALPRDGKDLSKCRFLLQNLAESHRDQYLLRVANEPVVTKKARLLRLIDTFLGQEVVRFLVAELNDTRFVEGGGLSSRRGLRICDVALNVLRKNLRNEIHVRIGIGGYGGDDIVPDVSIPKRDEWIATLKCCVDCKVRSEP